MPNILLWWTHIDNAEGAAEHLQVKWFIPVRCGGTHVCTMLEVQLSTHAER
jgi:hypothetical protein